MSTHDWVGIVLGAFVIGMLVMEWAAHDSADRNRKDAVPFDDHVDAALDVIKKTVIP